MHSNYRDIVSRINESPKWYDSNGAPRYDKFTPGLCPSIYSNFVVLARIGCQDCGEEFLVEMHAGYFEKRLEFPPQKWHYGDPPVHGCVGDTMNCIDKSVVEVWIRENFNWVRHPEFEGECDCWEKL